MINERSNLHRSSTMLSSNDINGVALPSNVATTMLPSTAKIHVNIDKSIEINSPGNSPKHQRPRRLQFILVFMLVLSMGGLLLQLSKVSRQFNIHPSSHDQTRKANKKHSSSPIMTEILSNIDYGRSNERNRIPGSDSIFTSVTSDTARTNKMNTLHIASSDGATNSTNVNNSSGSTSSRGASSWHSNSTDFVNIATNTNHFKAIGNNRPRNPLVQRPNRRPLVWSNLSTHHAGNDLSASKAFEASIEQFGEDLEELENYAETHTKDEKANSVEANSVKSSLKLKMKTW